MIQLFHNVNIDWLGNRRKFIFVSIVLMLAGLFSAIIRQATPGGTEAFNLGVVRQLQLHLYPRGNHDFQ